MTTAPKQCRPLAADRSPTTSSPRREGPLGPADLAQEQPRADEDRRGRAEPIRDRQQRRGQVGDQGRRGRWWPLAKVGPHERDVDAVRRRVIGSRLERGRLAVAPITGPQPSFAAAIASTPEPVPRSASGLPASPASASSSRKTPGTSSSWRAPQCRTPDRDQPEYRPRPRSRRPLPRWADNEPPAANLDRSVEVAPAVGPIVGISVELISTRPSPATASTSPRAGPPRRPVDRVLTQSGRAPPRRPRAPTRAARRAPARRAPDDSGQRGGSRPSSDPSSR